MMIEFLRLTDFLRSIHGVGRVTMYNWSYGIRMSMWSWNGWRSPTAGIILSCVQECILLRSGRHPLNFKSCALKLRHRVLPSRKVSYWLIPEVTLPTYQKVIEAFARNVGAGAEHHVLLVEDNAGFHGGAPPEGIEIVRLPPYSPELQPVERLWQLTDQTIVSKCFKSLEELLQIISKQCKLLETQRDRITKQTLFHWWPLCRN